MADILSQVLIVWCSDEKPNVIASILGRVDSHVVFRHMWIPLKDDSSRKVWGGVVAVFRSGVLALVALQELRTYSRSVHSIPFPELLEFFNEAEIQSPLFGIFSTRVLIKAKRSFHENIYSKVKRDDEFTYLNFETLMRYLGNAEHFEYVNGVQEYGVICTVDYSFVSHAYAAAIFMNSTFYQWVGEITVEVEKTEIEIAIAASVRERLGNYFDQAD